MKKLNNKGMTIVEIIATFVIVIAVLFALYKSIANLKQKKNVISYKQATTEYRDLLTRDIENDLIFKQLTSAEITNTSPNHKVIVFHFRNSSDKKLEVFLVPNNVVDENSEVCDNISSRIDMREADDGGEEDDDEYDGEDEEEDDNDGYDDDDDDEDEDKTDDDGGEEEDSSDVDYDTYAERIVYDNQEFKLPDVGGDNIVSKNGNCVRVNGLKIRNVVFSTENNIMYLYIELYHADLGTKYSIKIIHPMYY